jgi:peroxidase
MKTAFIFACVAVLTVVGVCQAGDLRKDFYRTSCPAAESIVKNITETRCKQPQLTCKVIENAFS